MGLVKGCLLEREIAFLLSEGRRLVFEVDGSLPIGAFALVLLPLAVYELLIRGDLAAAGLELVKLRQDAPLLLTA